MSKHFPEKIIQSRDPLDGLECLNEDGYLRYMNEKADDIEWRLRMLSLTPSAVDLLKLRQNLDSEWRYMNQEVVVAGRVMTPRQSVKAGLPEYEIEIIDQDEVVISTGYMFVALAGNPADENAIDYKVAYAFMRGEEQCAMLRDDFIGNFPDKSYETAEKRLFYHHRDEVARLNERLSRSEVPSVMDFQDYTLDVLMYARYNETYVSDVESYLLHSLNFDKVVPYLVEYGDEQKMLSVIATPEAMSLRPITNDDTESPRRHRPYLQLSVYGATPEVPNVHVSVPIASLHTFHSLRMPPRQTIK